MKWRYISNHDRKVTICTWHPRYGHILNDFFDTAISYVVCNSHKNQLYHLAGLQGMGMMLPEYMRQEIL